jgi:hypothetical protein
VAAAAAATAAAAAPAGAPAPPPSLSAATHRAPPDAWLPLWYLATVPSAAAAAGVPTLAAATLRVHALHRALTNKSIARVLQ